MGRGARVAVLVVIAIGIAIALFARAPIPQPPDYHSFADTRTLWRIPNALNVLSNVPFAIVGWLGLTFLARGPARGVDAPPRAGAHTAFVSYRERPAYVLFFAGVFLTAFGSSYYHLVPSTQRLFWDRLPMAIAFMALFAAVIAERIDVYWSRILLLPLVAFGVASVVVWKLSEDAGHGDLRTYVFVQGFPLLAIPLMMVMFPPAYTRSAELLVVVLLYGAAKALEVFDAKVWDALGHEVSGHSLKHVVAAFATYAVLDMLKHRSPKNPPAAEEAEEEPEEPEVE
jgi:hypothetical protein